MLLSGPIGSGKSTVRRLLENKGFTAIDADTIGHAVLLPDGLAFDAVAQRWPGVVVNGAIDRSRLAAIVFADVRQLRELEAITHPAIGAEIVRRVAAAGDRDVVVELPLLRPPFSNGGEGWHRLVVVGDAAIRLARAVDRGMDEDDVRRRMAAQPREAEWRAVADSVIVNDGSFDELAAAVDAWWAELTG